MFYCKIFNFNGYHVIFIKSIFECNGKQYIWSKLFIFGYVVISYFCLLQDIVVLIYCLEFSENLILSFIDNVTIGVLILKLLIRKTTDNVDTVGTYWAGQIASRLDVVSGALGSRYYATFTTLLLCFTVNQR